MSFPRYAEFKESGVQSLGEVPSHWDVSRTIKYARTHRDGIAPANVTHETVFHYSIPNIQARGAGQMEDGDTIDSNKLTIKERQLLVSKLNPHKQCIVIADPHSGTTTIASTEFVPLVPQGADIRFLLYLWQSQVARHRLLAVADSATRSHQRVSPDEISKATWAWPPFAEQQVIARFLDRETAKIDALVAELEKLIALLKEKRQALISHAVTKGLNPNAPMKDSGIEWLGQVPAHWRLLALKRLVRQGSSISYGIVQPGEPLDEGVPFVQTTNMTSGNFEIQALQHTTQEIAASYPRSQLNGGEVLLGIRASIGAAFVAPDSLRGANLSRGVARIECSSEIMPAYLVAYLRSNPTTTYWRLSMQGSTFSEVSIDSVKQLTVLVPPPEEQERILGHLSRATHSLDKLLDEAKLAIDLLKERRSALISAAVTGKIDVRNLAK